MSCRLRSWCSSVNCSWLELVETLGKVLLVHWFCSDVFVHCSLDSTASQTVSVKIPITTRMLAWGPCRLPGTCSTVSLMTGRWVSVCLAGVNCSQLCQRLSALLSALKVSIKYSEKQISKACRINSEVFICWWECLTKTLGFWEEEKKKNKEGTIA